ncbi:hypothetical protein SAMN04488136_101222 [Vibrio xiamenensis]|uniref:Uncharacterized protein n=1 Tax=Vibrio xiamenensis TaxID=861298 RepID=A0A1G7W6T2_9VIBR|nr:hypothetical protein [Vibrio xiamenensis]SDG67684.1 hypothetical protein SAMN04488136_101222 [Vibrio xiamenensis]
MFNKSAVALGVSFMLSGCISTGPDAVCTPDTTVPIASAEVPATSNEDKKVIVLPVDFEFKDSAKGKLQTVIRNSLESHVTSTGTHLVDRKLANKLKGEIKLAEQSGRYNSKGVPIADYAVLTEVTSSDLSKSHDKAYSYKNKKGETVNVPAKCSYEVDVTAVVKVVSLPDMGLVKRIELSGDHSFTTETSNSSCPISEAQYQGLASKAGEEASEHNNEIKTLLAAKASILELRQCEAGNMVKIAIGSDKNVQPNDTVAFSTIMKNSEGELETFAVGEGEVVNIPNHGIKAKYSWVGIDEETALKVRKGDVAQIVPKKCTSLLDLECQAKGFGEQLGL